MLKWLVRLFYLINIMLEYNLNNKDQYTLCKLIAFV